MDSLTHLVRNLRPGELQTIRAYYKSRFSDDNKRLQLLQLLSSGQAKDNYKIAQRIYNQKPNSSLSKLKERVKEDMLNFILLFPADNLKVSLFVKSDLTCRKMLLQGKVLLARGIFEEGIYLIRKAAHLAEKHELIDVSIAVNDTLRTRFADQDIAHVNKLNDKIRVAQETYRDLLAAKELYQVLLRMQQTGEENIPAGDNTVVRDELDYLRERAGKTGSKRVAFWYKLAAMRFYRITGQYEQSIRFGLEVLDMIADEPFLSSNQAAVAVHTDLADQFARRNQFKDAETHGHAALKLCSRDDRNELHVLVQLFKIYFQGNAMDQAGATANRIVQHPKLDQYKDLQAIWQFYMACLEFNTGQFKDSIKRLHTLARVFGNRKQYTVAVKYLELLNIIELGDADWFEYKLEAYRKYVGKIEEDWCARYKTIYHIFQALLSCNFDYSKVVRDGKCAELFGNLEPKDAGTWPSGLDMVNFHHWLHRKAGTTDGTLSGT
jgi:hypothetical protein